MNSALRLVKPKMDTMQFPVCMCLFKGCRIGIDYVTTGVPMSFKNTGLALSTNTTHSLKINSWFRNEADNMCLLCSGEKPKQKDKYVGR